MNAQIITGKRNQSESWEKQDIYDLSNGCTVTVCFNQHYGELVSRIDDAQGYWHASSGRETLPARFAFALAWVRPVSPGHWQSIMVPPSHWSRA